LGIFRPLDPRRIIVKQIYIAATALTLAVLSLASSASATTFTWNNANLSGTWATGSNWVGGMAPSINTVNSDIVYIDGETGTNVTTNLGGNVYFMDQLNVSAVDVVEGSGLLRMNGPTNKNFINAGTIRATTGNLTLEQAAGVSVNTGTISASGSRTIALGAASIINTGGNIQVTSGATLHFRGQSIITGGNVSIDGTSQFISGDVQDKFTFNGVNFDNAGTLTWLQQATAGNRTKWLEFGTTTDVTNTGSINITQNADAMASPTRTIDIRVTGNATFDNQGTLSVTTNNGAATGTHTSAFTLSSSAASGFTNTGTVTIAHAAGAALANTAQFVSGGNIANAGTFNLSGTSASIELGSNNFNQSAGRLFLDNDAFINAALVNIAGGELAGSGTLNSNVNIDDTLNMRIGTTNDLLVVSGNIVLNSATSILDLDEIGSFTGPVDLVQFSGTLTGTFSSVLGLPDFYQVQYGQNAISLVEYVPAPEPSSLCLLGLGFVVLLKRSKTRKRA
jgi:hypothetical protein